ELATTIVRDCFGLFLIFVRINYRIYQVQLVKTTNCENYAPDASVAFSSGMIKSGLSLVVRII
ncbi:hypothetical protein, partial [Lactiplantibacillus plantarum]|uniref:hypothetical protein n=1 Tax=Lactiplantibacillus plantarum TaxID=1590 RepID=UPI001E64950B